MRIQLDEGAIMPSRAHKADAGLDLMARECGIVPAHGSATFRTGVHVEIPEGCVDEDVAKALEGKTKTQDALIEALKTRLYREVDKVG